MKDTDNTEKFIVKCVAASSLTPEKEIPIVKQQQQ